jgi:GTP-binding protein
LNISAGEAIMGHRLKGYEPWKGDIPNRIAGVLISMENGKSVTYAMDKLQDRGKFFLDAGEDIYEGQIIGEHIRPVDMCINISKTKQLTNFRASGTDDKSSLAPPIKMSLEETMEYIQEDEYVEVTPKSIRLRKILLSENDRKRAAK